MDGNIAQSTHDRYMEAMNEFMDPNHPSVCSYSTLLAELAQITEINHVRYDVCRNNCICYATFPDAQECHLCHEPRLDKRGNPWKTFDYIPITHRLRLLYTDSGYVRRTVQYKQPFQDKLLYTAENPRTSTCDYWDSLLHSTFQNDRDLWQDVREVGFIFSTDGFSLFKVGNFDVWPLLLINANLSPNECVLKKNMTLCGSIPGPENPKDIGSFLTPLIEEFVVLQDGVRAWDGLRQEEFTLRAHISLIAGDTMAMAKLMKWTGRR